MEKILRSIQRLIPRRLYKFFQPTYHYLLAFAGKIIYGFPSRKIKVIAVTGTKGKSSTTEYVNAILEEAGYKTSLLSTIRFKIGDENRRNMYKMTMPGRFFVQKFLRDSVDAGCSYAIIEMTSEGSRFHRHHGVHIDALIVTNITPEHIESHGSFEKYLNAKLNIAGQLVRSKKNNRILVTSNESEHLDSFHNHKVETNLTVDTLNLEDIDTGLAGDFNKANAKLAMSLAMELGVSEATCRLAIKKLKYIAGRAEEIMVTDSVENHKLKTQNFKVIVDYAHTVESLSKIYSAYPGKRIAVLGACGGGRDISKQPLLGEVADKMCDIVIVTDEDPYDDDVMTIIENVARGVKNKKMDSDLFIIKNRREAIAKSIVLADILSKTNHDVSVIITGKGTDPYIMREGGSREDWSDSEVAREELKRCLSAHFDK